MLNYGEKEKPIIKLEIPGELITRNSKEINYELIKGRKILGLCGYAGAGKDEFAKPLVKRLGFKRISFGDSVKELMDKHMKLQMYEDLKKRGIDLPLDEVNQLHPKNRTVKEVLRPYLIWFGEEMKKINGLHYWTNIAFESIGDSEKIVITDVRRLNEVGIFENSTQSYEKTEKDCKESGYIPIALNKLSNIRGYESMLLHISQKSLKDKDELTHESIRKCFEEWLFDEIIHINPAIPDKYDYRNKHVLNHIHKLVQKYPNFFI